MRVRNWLIRGLILAGVAALAALAWMANSWISPERVREKVIVTLSEQFEGADVHVGSARMRILGGIAVTDLRLTRRGDPPDQPFLVVPNAILYHDKEKLNHGQLVIRKVDMDGCTLRIERSADGKWNLAEMVKPKPGGTADTPIPTLVVKNGTITVIDRTPGALPPATFTDVQCTLLNDPLIMLTVQATGSAKGYGSVSIRGRLNRTNKHLSLSVDLNEFPLGEAAVPATKRFAPELAPHVAKITAVASVKAELNYTPDAIPQWRHDVQFEVKDARFEHPDLPKPVEKIAAKVRSVDGRIKVEEATAQIGQAKVKVSLETRTDATPVAVGATATSDAFRRIEDNLQKFEITATGVALDDSLFEHLPEKLKRGRKMFNPSGQVDLGYKFTREGAGWRRELEVRPQQAGMIYEKFPYPVSDVRGLVKKTFTHAGGESTTVDLVGTAAGQLITLNGRIDGEGDDPAIYLRITGNNVPIDDRLFAAFPTKYAQVIREFRASGRGNFVAVIAQKQGVNLCEMEFRVDIEDGKLNYTAFPYPLEKLKGRLVVRTMATNPKRPLRPGESLYELPDRDEIMFDGFTAVHAGAVLSMNGTKQLATNGRDRLLVLHIGANNLPLDAELKAALTAAKVDGLWGTLSPRGKITFGADVEVLDRAPVKRPEISGEVINPPLDPANDIKLTLDFTGPTVTPSFFAYELTDLSGRLEYKNNKLDLLHLAARHGPSRVKLGHGEILFYPDGMVHADIQNVEMKPLIADASLRKALPGKLGPALEELQLKGGTELSVKRLVVQTPPEVKPSIPLPAVLPPRGGMSPTPTPTRPDPIVFWNAELKLFGASLDTGVLWEDAFGSIACKGLYEGTRLGLVCGNVWLERALVSRMPITSAKCEVRAEPQEPDPARPGQYLPIMLQFSKVAGDLFDGTVGGQACVVLTDPTRYEVLLTVAGAQLEKVARHYKLGPDADLKGIAQAQLLVYNKPDPKTGRFVTEGWGKIDVPTGRMYNLPILLELVKVFKGSAPDPTAFDQAHAVFRIQGDRIKVDQLDLIGKAICVGGSGELDSSGEYVKFEFYTVWSQVLKQMINTPVGDLTEFLSKNLFTIKMVRENGELKYRPQPVPLVTEPAKAVIERLKRGAAKVMGK